MNIVRRRWTASLPRVRQLRPFAALSERLRLALIIEGLLLMVGIWAALTFSLPGDTGRLEVGQPSPLSIWAPREAIYTSEVLTAEKQAQAESSPDNLVYAYDPEVPLVQRQALASLLDTISSVRSDPTDSRADRLDRLASLPNATVQLTAQQADLILTLGDQGWETLRIEALALYDRAIERYDYAIDDRGLTQLRDRWLTYWLATTTLSPNQRDLAQFFVESFLRVNRVLDEAATAERRRQAREQVPLQQVEVLAGESIVRMGEIVRPETIEKLQQTGAMPRALSWPGVIGRGLLAALLAAGFIGYAVAFQHDLARRPRSLLVIIGLMIVTLILARLLLPLTSDTPTFFPLATVAIVLAVVFNGRLGIAAAALLSVSIGVMENNALPLVTVLFASCVAAAYMARSAERLLTFVLAGIGITLVLALGEIAFWLIEQSTFRWEALASEVPLTLLFAATNGGLSTILALGVFNVVSRAAGQVTALQLMELAHPSRPLLRKLIREAPGTYYHSVAVGNLAEAAAEAVGADALLLRVAAYYHDIGKTIRPYFFTDNQIGRENVHNDLDPHTSAQIIVDHVREGVKMARAAGLPQQIIDFIATHHGTGLIKHFYQLALQQQDAVNSADFRYPGPKPQTREQAILMLADSVEATVRSKAQNGKLVATRSEESRHTPLGGSNHTLDDLVQSIIDTRVREGELDEAPLTMHELALIKQAFVLSLQSIYHPRVDYSPGGR